MTHDTTRAKCDCDKNWFGENKKHHASTCASLATKCDKCGALLGINFGGSPLAHFDDCPTLSPTPNAAGTARAEWLVGDFGKLVGFKKGLKWVTVAEIEGEDVNKRTKTARLIVDAVNAFEGLKGEVERLRGALEQIARPYPGSLDPNCPDPPDPSDIAREALQGGGK